MELYKKMSITDKVDWINANVKARSQPETLQASPEDNDLMRALMQFTITNQVIHYPVNIDTFINKGYAYNPHVYTVITWKCKNKSQVPFCLYKVVDKKNYSEYIRHKDLGNHPEARLYATKALEKIETGALANIFKQPNPSQGWADFIFEICGFLDITGNSYTYGLTPSGYAENLYSQMFTAPSQLMQIISGGWLNPIQAYKVIWSWDRFTQIEKDKIMHLKHWNPKTDRRTGMQLYGMSPLESHLRTLKRSNESVDGSLAMLVNGNPGGVLSNDSERLVKEPEMLEQRRTFDKNFGGGKNLNRIVLAASKVSWQQIGLSSVDLELLESDKVDFGTICRAYGLDEIIFNPDKSSYNNKITAEKSVWQNTLIPELNKLRESFNKFLLDPWSANDRVQYYCDYDVSNIPCLQTDLKELTERITPLYDRGVYTINDVLIMMGGEPDMANEFMNKRWMDNRLHELGVDPKVPDYSRDNPPPNPPKK